MKPTWIVHGGLGLLVWVGSVVGPAQAGTIAPVGTATGVTLSIFRQTSSGVFQDITDSYLPDWAPGATAQTVYVVVNGTGTPSLVPPTATAPSAATPNPFLTQQTTSAYPGNCTNYGTGTGADFTFGAFNVTVGATTYYSLTSNDCGGMAVIDIGGTKFVVPRDANLNGIPDSWEATFCPGNPSSCPTGREDADTSPSNPGSGDGFAALDEYRGFIESGQHVRTDPRQKDFFIHVVNPQCGANNLSLVGGGTRTLVTGGDQLFGNVNTINARLHLLGYVPNATNYRTDEWIDKFFSYTTTGGFLYKTNPTDTATLRVPPANDRQVNVNAVYPSRNSALAPLPQKGVRVVECVVLDTSTTMGVAPTGSSPNGAAANAVVYTRRILNYFDCLIGNVTPCPVPAPAPAAATVPYATFQNGAPTAAALISHDELIAKAIKFYLAMETAHVLKLTPTQEGTAATPTLYGYHHAPGTGSNLDQTIQVIGTTFFIPQLYNTSDQTNFAVK